jgi:hypothetical protein
LRVAKPSKNLNSIKSTTKELEEETKGIENKLLEL